MKTAEKIIIEAKHYNHFNRKQGEKWKYVIVDGIEYHNYLISSYGRVFSVRRNRLMTLNDNGVGYLQCHLSLQSSKESFLLVHRLVAEAFIPNSDETKNVVNHVDEFDTHNNHVDNLCWCTQSENVLYGTAQERRKIAVSKKVNIFDLNKKLICEFESAIASLKFLGISQSTLFRYLKSGKPIHDRYIVKYA
jgi:hypothetical protein